MHLDPVGFAKMMADSCLPLVETKYLPYGSWEGVLVSESPAAQLVMLSKKQLSAKCHVFPPKNGEDHGLCVISMPHLSSRKWYFACTRDGGNELHVVPQDVSYKAINLDKSTIRLLKCSRAPELPWLLQMSEEQLLHNVKKNCPGYNGRGTAAVFWLAGLKSKLQESGLRLKIPPRTISI